MAFDTFIVFVGVYSDVDAADADYDLVKDLHTKAVLIDAYDAAVIQRREDRTTRSRSFASTRRRPASAAYWAAGSDWQPRTNGSPRSNAG